MKLSVVSLFLLAASASAAAIPGDSEDLVARDNHSPTAPPEHHGTRASYSVDIAELEAQIAQAEHDRAVLDSLGEHEAAQRKSAYAAQLRAQLEAYQDAERNNGAIWAGIGKRQQGLDATTRQILLLEKQRRQLLALGRTAEADAKAREIARLKLRQNPDLAKEEARGKRATVTVNFAEIEAQIRTLEHEIAVLQQLGEVDAVRRREQQLAQLRGQLETYADAERNNADRFGGRSLAARDLHEAPEQRDNHATRGSISVNIPELKAKIRKAQKDYDTLRSMGEHAAAKRKLKYINALKAKLRAYEDADSNAAGHFKRSVADFEAVDVARMA